MYSGRRVTLDDIATASGTSIATVSRALQGSPRVASATRERIEKVAEELGYRANVAASPNSRPDLLLGSGAARALPLGYPPRGAAEGL